MVHIGMTRRRGGALTVMVFVALVAAVWTGCGGSKGERGTTQPAPGEPAKGRSASGARTVRFTTTLEGNQDAYRLTIYSLRRSGPFVTLNAGLKCERADGNGYCLTQANFKGEGIADGNTFAGVRLLDVPGLKEYRVVRDGQDRPYASEAGSAAQDMRAGERVWARFSAPPVSVRSLTILLPDGGPRIEDVPITEGGAVEPARPRQFSAKPAEFDRPPGSSDASGLKPGVTGLSLDVVSRGGDEQSRERGDRGTVTLAADVLFAFNRANLGKGAGVLLGDVAAKIRQRARGPVSIDGYTDSKGSDAYNLGLSRRRAETVRRALAPRLGPDRPLRARGHGEDDPVAPNAKPDGSDNPKGRALNRRVTIGYSVARRVLAPEPSPQPSGSAPAGAPVRSASFSLGDASGQADLRVDVVGLRRVGRLAVLDLRLTCERDTLGRCGSETQFAQGSKARPGQQTQAFYTAGAVTLLDPSQQARYLTVLDDERIPLTASVDMKPGRTYPVWLYFPAPPASLKTITVKIPNGGPALSGIPIR